LPCTTARRRSRRQRHFFIDAETVREYRRLYCAGGQEGVEKLHYEGSELALTPDQLKALEAERDARLYTTARAICGFVEWTFDVTYSLHAMTKRLNRQVFVYKKPKCVPAKANEVPQRKLVEECLDPLMSQVNDNTPLYFVDETHPSHTSHAAHGWISKGDMRELKSSHNRPNININGALSRPGREFVHRHAERITRAETILLFQDLQARHPTLSAIRVVLATRAIIIRTVSAAKVLVDFTSGRIVPGFRMATAADYGRSFVGHRLMLHLRAHTFAPLTPKEVKAWRACDDCRIELVPLPPYSPNLKLIERFRMWRKLAPRYFVDSIAPRMAGQHAGVNHRVPPRGC